MLSGAAAVIGAHVLNRNQLFARAGVSTQTGKQFLSTHTHTHAHAMYKLKLRQVVAQFKLLLALLLNQHYECLGDRSV